jgi:hypothetical protein
MKWSYFLHLLLLLFGCFCSSCSMLSLLEDDKFIMTADKEEVMVEIKHDSK